MKLPVKSKKDTVISARVSLTDVNILKSVDADIPEIVRRALSAAASKILRDEILELKKEVKNEN